MRGQVFCSDNIEKLKEYPDNYFDSIVTDGPYGLGDEPDPIAVLAAWIEKGYYEITGKGFMGKEWDAFVPQPAFWKEVFRVLKPGGYVLSFFSTRTYDWGVMAMRIAGFEVRDQIQWIFGNGMPKNMDVSKKIDQRLGMERKVVGKAKRWGNGTSGGRGGQKANDYQVTIPGVVRYDDITAPGSEEAQKYDGFGTNLKPAYEPIVMCRKPISEKTVADNVLKHGTGAINIDACRIDFANAADENETKAKNQHSAFDSGKRQNKIYGVDNKDREDYDEKGRWPSNIIFTHHPDCVCTGTKMVKGTCSGNGEAEVGVESKGAVKPLRRGKMPLRADADGLEEVESWECVDGCPIKELDEQSGTSKSTIDKNITKNSTNSWFADKYHDRVSRGDAGGASRFFYVAKASRTERNEGLWKLPKKHASHDGRQATNETPYQRHSNMQQNFHPTVKPIALMRQLVKLVTPPGGIVLDPFGGSGTTGCACEMEGIKYVLIDNDPQAHEVAQLRCEHWYKKSLDQQRPLL